MAIYACGFYVIYVAFDGTSTSMVYDFTDLIKNDNNIKNKVLKGVQSANFPGSPTAVVTGNKVTWTWGAAPAAGESGYNIYLQFDPS